MADVHTPFRVIRSETIDSLFVHTVNRIAIGLRSQEDPRKGNWLYEMGAGPFYGDGTQWICVNACDPQPGENES